MSIYHSIEQVIASYFKVEFSIVLNEVSLQQTKKEFSGDLTFVLFPYLKKAQKSPQELGTSLGSFLVDNTEEIVTFNIVEFPETFQK